MLDPMIHAGTLAPRLHRPDAPDLLDLRLEADAAGSTRLPGARRLSLAEVEAGAPVGPEAVVYCQKGGKISQIGAALLRARGIAARALVGGHLGWDGPTVALEAPALRWVAPLDPAWAGVAAEWVLRRLIDRTARVVRVEADEVDAAAALWPARILPDDASGLAASVGLSHPVLPRLAPTPGAERMLAGARALGRDPLAVIDAWVAA